MSRALVLTLAGALATAGCLQDMRAPQPFPGGGGDQGRADGSSSGLGLCPDDFCDPLDDYCDEDTACAGDDGVRSICDRDPGCDVPADASNDDGEDLPRDEAPADDDPPADDPQDPAPVCVQGTVGTTCTSNADCDPNMTCQVVGCDVANAEDLEGQPGSCMPTPLQMVFGNPDCGGDEFVPFACTSTSGVCVAPSVARQACDCGAVLLDCSNVL